MRKLTLVLMAFLLAGCFEQGEIQLQANRVNVRVDSDPGGVVSMLADAFLNAEAQNPAYLIQGLGRNVYFDVNGIVPAACTPSLNCYSYNPATQPPFKVFTTGSPDGQALTPQELAKAQALFAEFNLELVGVHTNWDILLRTTFPFGHHGYWNAAYSPYQGLWEYFDLWRAGNTPPCEALEWVNQHYEQDGECDGLDDEAL